jgi:uncharacterized MAPEG superfamily protein
MMENAEIYWLTLTVIMTAVIWVPYIINRIRELGLINALMYREVDPKPKAAWANRMMHAHKNAVENLIIFAPLVIITAVLGVSNEVTLMAAMVYFFTRLAHLAVYTFGVPFLRTVTFFIGFLCQLAIGFEILAVL